MKMLWTSPDRLVVVADDVSFVGGSEVRNLFLNGAWIVVWRKAPDEIDEHEDYEDGGIRWRVTRSSRNPKPNLILLRHRVDEEISRPWHCHPDGWSAWQMSLEDDPDPVVFAQALYAAWQQLAADELPAKVAQLDLNKDEPEAERIPAWLRPGLAEYAHRRREVREIMAEIAD